MGILSSNSYHICQDFGHTGAVRLHCYVSDQQVVRDGLAGMAADDNSVSNGGKRKHLKEKAS